MELDTEVGVIMAGQLRWLLVLILSDTVFSTPGLVMVREEGGREKREVREELERWRSALRSDLLGRNSDGIEEMEVRKRREVGAETGKRIEIKSNDAIAPTITKSNDAIGPTIVKGRERKYRRLEHSIMVQADIRSRSVIFIFIFIFIINYHPQSHHHLKLCLHYLCLRHHHRKHCCWGTKMSSLSSGSASAIVMFISVIMNTTSNFL